MKDMKDMKEQKATFPYRKLFTPDLNVFSLCKSYYSILHILHILHIFHHWQKRYSQVSHLCLVNGIFR